MEQAFVIKGGRPLSGEVTIRGSKNAASKMMVASLLTRDPCVIENVPRSAEVDITRELCENIGSTVEFSDSHTLRIETPYVLRSFVPELSRKNRIPILALAPLLHRTGFAEIPVLGGCPIGHRPINFHIEALTRMGAEIERRERSYFAKTRGLHGAEIEFPFPSVGATENVLLAAVLAKGRTVIKNAAVEPEIMNLVEMLRAMGAKISVATEERRFEIEGVGELGGATARVMPDRNEIVSFASAALATGGEIFIPDISEEYLEPFLKTIERMGYSYNIQKILPSPSLKKGGEAGCELKAGIKFWGGGPYYPVDIETSPHPGFMTDWQQPVSLLLTRAQGRSIIHETVYEDRFGYTGDLVRMGAKISLSDKCMPSTGSGNNILAPEPAYFEQRRREGQTLSQCRFFAKGFNHLAEITGPVQLRGTEIAVSDIRAGMAHIIAALAAEGESMITGIEHIDRGYERIDERLRELGADIRRIPNS